MEEQRQAAECGCKQDRDETKLHTSDEQHRVDGKQQTGENGGIPVDGGSHAENREYRSENAPVQLEHALFLAEEAAWQQQSAHACKKYEEQHIADDLQCKAPALGEGRRVFEHANQFLKCREQDDQHRQCREVDVSAKVSCGHNKE